MGITSTSFLLSIFIMIFIILKFIIPIYQNDYTKFKSERIVLALIMLVGYFLLSALIQLVIDTFGIK